MTSHLLRYMTCKLTRSKCPLGLGLMGAYLAKIGGPRNLYHVIMGTRWVGQSWVELVQQSPERAADNWPIWPCHVTAGHKARSTQKQKKKHVQFFMQVPIGGICSVNKSCYVHIKNFVVIIRPLWAAEPVGRHAVM